MDGLSFSEWLTTVKMYPEAVELGEKNNPGIWETLEEISPEVLRMMFGEYYKEWEDTLENGSKRKTED